MYALFLFVFTFFGKGVGSKLSFYVFILWKENNSEFEIMMDK